MILYPRYLDPVTELPCPPEILLRRLAEGFPISRAAISQHLKALLGAGFVSYRKHGPLNIYSLNPGPLLRLKGTLGELGQRAVDGAQRWSLRASWFERI